MNGVSRIRPTATIGNDSKQLDSINQTLPKELLYKIFCSLDKPKELLLKVGLVCKNWQQLIKKDAEFHRQYCLQNL